MLPDKEAISKNHRSTVKAQENARKGKMLFRAFSCAALQSEKGLAASFRAAAPAAVRGFVYAAAGVYAGRFRRLFKTR